jgi:autotransporter-associated beta strand protein
MAGYNKHFSNRPPRLGYPPDVEIRLVAQRKREPLMNRYVARRRLSELVALVSTSILSPELVVAADKYWDGTGMSWNNASSWSTSLNTPTPDPAAKPGASDIAFFNIKTVNSPQTVDLNAAQAALGLDFSSTGTVLIESAAGGGSANALTLGTQGITVNVGSGADTISAPVNLSGSQSWTNNSASLLTVSGNVSNGANLLTVGGTGNTTIGGVLGGGSGGVAKNGAGQLVLSNSNTFTGGVTINGGSLRLDHPGALNSATPNAVTFGAASTGVLTLNGNSITIPSLNTNALPGTPVVQNANSSAATLTVNNSAANTFAGMLQDGAGGGALSLLKTGVGELILSGANAYTGGTTVGAGTLRGNAGSLQGNITNNAAVIFDQAGAGTYAGSMSGTGSFTKLGAGTLTLSGNNLYTGGTTISAGTLRGNANSLQGNIINNAAVIFDQAGAATYAGAMSGTGSLTKLGAGTLTLSGINQYTGATNVNEGTLALPAAATFSVGAGAGTTSELNISGTGAAFVQSDAAALTVGAASGSPAAINIGTTANGGTLTTGTGLFTINPTGTVTIGGGANTGTLNANGNVTFNGGQLVVVTPGSAFLTDAGKTITVQNGGNVSVIAGTHTSPANTIYNIAGTGAAWHGLNIDNGAQVNVTSGGVLDFTFGNSSGNSTLSIQDANSVANGSQVRNNSTINVGTTASGGKLQSSTLFTIDGTSTVNIGSATTSGTFRGFPTVDGGVFQLFNSSSTLDLAFVPNAGFMTVQNGGRATFDLNGGIYHTSNAVLGTQLYTVSGTNSVWELVDGSGLTIGYDDFVQIVSGGHLSVAGDVMVGTPATRGTLEMFGTLTARSLLVNQGGVTPSVFQLGGTLNITGAAGLITGDVDSDFSVGPSATINVTNATTISAFKSFSLEGGTLNTGSLVINGAFNFVRGTLGITGPAGMTVGTGGPLGSTLVLNANQTLNVTNTLTVGAGAYLTVAGGLSAGNLLNNGDLVAINTAINAPVANNNAVTVVGTVDFNGLVSGPGDFFGPGTAHFNGGIAPGASPAEVSFEGNLALADANILFIELGGATPGSQYDRLSIDGSATIDGDLNVSLLGGFSPTSGQSFNILTAAGGISGTFDAATLPALAGGLYFNLAYNSTAVTLSVAGILGDYNRNGNVDAADYVLWRKSLAQLGPPLAADGNNNGLIDPADFTIWRNNYGTSAAGSGAAAIPEPTTLALVAIALCFAATRRKS